MFTLRCTKRVFDYLGCKPEASPPAPSTVLGDWYANLVEFPQFGELLVFVNERSLLTVAVPFSGESSMFNLPTLFIARLSSLLAKLGVPEAEREKELSKMTEIHFAKTSSKKVLGSMKDICFQGALKSQAAECSLSKIELYLAELVHKNLSLKTPAATVYELLKSQQSDTRFALQ